MQLDMQLTDETSDCTLAEIKTFIERLFAATPSDRASMLRKQLPRCNNLRANGRDLAMLTVMLSNSSGELKFPIGSVDCMPYYWLPNALRLASTKWTDAQKGPGYRSVNANIVSVLATGLQPSNSTTIPSIMLALGPIIPRNTWGISYITLAIDLASGSLILARMLRCDYDDDDDDDDDSEAGSDICDCIEQDPLHAALVGSIGDQPFSFARLT
ncbi:hypothetical protein K431DRAFT_307954 [Polychaeton citri CBS 116435]|uniref:Uncharacterized protein n=1 Tax=Polychaeton citri CBS 116435 TaxID=1314669 RepID=A0A9P4UKS8_9PEZI|nr:hypothetical protein K431DRAFT_307954 [Polychaeton citri CBS 116435]